MGLIMVNGHNIQQIQVVVGLLKCMKRIIKHAFNLVAMVFEVSKIALLSRPMEWLIDHLGISFLVGWIIKPIACYHGYALHGFGECFISPSSA